MTELSFEIDPGCKMMDMRDSLERVPGCLVLEHIRECDVTVSTPDSIPVSHSRLTSTICIQHDLDAGDYERKSVKRQPESPKVPVDEVDLADMSRELNTSRTDEQILDVSKLSDDGTDDDRTNSFIDLSSPSKLSKFWKRLVKKRRWSRGLLCWKGTNKNDDVYTIPTKAR